MRSSTHQNPTSLASVIICCYNSEALISPTLSHLVECETGTDLEIEVTIVDNNCTDNTVRRAHAQLNTAGLDYKIVEEKKPGLIHARRTGMRHSKGEYYIFIDDDNWLSTGYIRGIHEIFRKNPDVGIIAGRGIPEFQKEEPLWFNKYQKYFAIPPPEKPTGPCSSVYGAGMAIRREVIDALDRIGFESMLLGRNGDSLSSGEDSELCYAARIAGWKIYYDRELTFKHYMPDKRMDESYLIRILYGVNLSSAMLFTYRSATKSRTPMGGALRCYRKAFSSMLHCMRVHKRKDKPCERQIAIADAKYQSWRQLGALGTIRVMRKLFQYRQNLRKLNTPQPPANL